MWQVGFGGAGTTVGSVARASDSVSVWTLGGVALAVATLYTTVGSGMGAVTVEQGEAERYRERAPERHRPATAATWPSAT